MDAVDLARQLAALSDSLNSTNLLISRLAKLPVPPGPEPPGGDSGARVELSQDIHERLKQLEEELECVTHEADDYQARTSPRRRRGSRAAEDARLAAHVIRLGEELAHSRQRFRTAQVVAKQARERAKRREREALLEAYRREADHLAAAADDDAAPTDGGGSAEGDPRARLFARRKAATAAHPPSTKDEVLVAASGDVTSALRRTHALLASELDRSRFAHDTLDQSARALAQLGEEYGKLDGILGHTRTLLGTLLRSQKSDTWYLENAFYLLAATLAWLVFRRILYGPLIKLPVFLAQACLFLARRLLLPPLLFLLTLLGLLAPDSAPAPAPASIPSRAPLIVQPSAHGPAPAPARAPHARGSIPAGAGGRGAKQQRPPSAPHHRLSDRIADMAAPPPPPPPTRGDGAVLPPRAPDAPANPKKRVFEADVQDEKQRRAAQQAATATATATATERDAAAAEQKEEREERKGRDEL